MKSIHLKKQNKVVSFLLSLCIVCVIGIIPVHAATQDVRVTNWPTSYEVTNISWSSRLANIESATSNLATNVGNLVSRFGWNSTLTFSDGFELLYNDVHSFSSSTVNSDILSKLNNELPNGTQGSSNSTKGLIRRIVSSIGENSSYSVLSGLSSIDTYTQHIDSDLHNIDTNISTISSNVSDIKSYTSTIRNNTNTMVNSWSQLFQNISTKANQIKADTGNISVDTEHISGTQDVLVSQSAITMSNVEILRQFFADDDTLAQKAASKQTSDYAIDIFTNANSLSSASMSDYTGIASMSDSIGSNLNTNVNIGVGLGYFNGQYSNETGGWFSEATYNAFHAGQNNRSDNDGMRSADAYYPLLEQYYADVLNYTLGDER